MVAAIANNAVGLEVVKSGARALVTARLTVNAMDLSIFVVVERLTVVVAALVKNDVELATLVYVESEARALVVAGLAIIIMELEALVIFESEVLAVVGMSDLVGKEVSRGQLLISFLMTWYETFQKPPN